MSRYSEDVFEMFFDGKSYRSTLEGSYSEYLIFPVNINNS